MNLNPNKLVFVHVPKCAGTSMARGLQAKEDHIVYHCATNRNEEWLTKHNPDNKRRVLEFDSSWYAFGFIRNPFDRIISAWKTRWVSGPTQGNLMDFLEYIDETDDEFAKSHVYSFLDPRQKLFNEDGTQRVNFIGRYENLHGDFKLVCSNMSIDKIKLPHKNRGERGRYQDYYNDESRKIVEKRYEKDLNYFNYEF
tara:strand:+ start:871 stop:1461 length:591 start_codon:yes stop_codon:yes gene_type:complete